MEFSTSQRSLNCSTAPQSQLYRPRFHLPRRVLLPVHLPQRRVQPFSKHFKTLAMDSEIPRASDDTGLSEEHIRIGAPSEHRDESGQVFVHYSESVEETEYEQVRIVRYGQLCVVFSPDLKVAPALIKAEVPWSARRGNQYASYLQ